MPSSLSGHLLRHHSQRHQPSSLAVVHRASSPSASSSTATSTSARSASTTATQLSELAQEVDHTGKDIAPASDSPSSSSMATRVRSRAVTSDAEIQAAASPRQRSRISHDPEMTGTKEQSASVAGNEVAMFEDTSVISMPSVFNDEESGTLSAGSNRSIVSLPSPQRGRPPKKKDGVARLPTRKQRKQ